MPILELQRRIAEAGRIRIGQQVPTSGGRTRPEKLTTFRMTSADRTKIDALAEMYGGKVAPWKAPAGEQWEVITETAALDVIVPPGDLAFSQFFELWSAGGCKRRCDGVNESLSDGPCLCNPEQRECEIHTRLSLLLRDLPGLGVWRLDTQGYYAAVELQGAIEMFNIAARRGMLLPARLLLEQRSVKRPNGKGGVQTLRYAVPRLDPLITPGQMLGGGDVIPLQLATAADGNHSEEVRTGLIPIPASAEPVPSIAEQSAPPEPPGRRVNAAAPIPSSGRRRAERAEQPSAAAAPDPDPDQVLTGADLERMLSSLHAAMSERTEMPDQHAALRAVAAAVVALGDRSLNELTLGEWRQLANTVRALPVIPQPGQSGPAPVQTAQASQPASPDEAREGDSPGEPAPAPAPAAASSPPGGGSPATSSEAGGVPPTASPPAAQPDDVLRKRYEWTGSLGLTDDQADEAAIAATGLSIMDLEPEAWAAFAMQLRELAASQPPRPGTEAYRRLANGVERSKARAYWSEREAVEARAGAQAAIDASATGGEPQ